VALKILAVSSEAFPLAKTGGLGDAVSGMAQALQAAGAQPGLLLPGYDGVLQKLSSPREVARLEGLPGGAATLMAGRCTELGLGVLLLCNDALYGREGLYMDAEGREYEDNAVRFAALSHAAARIAAGVPGLARPDIVHVHDWHAALTPLCMRQLQVHDTRTVLTLHNVAFQGVFAREAARDIGVQSRFVDEDLEYWGRINLLKAGIRHADLITVVSRNYANEILTPRFGCGLEDVLGERRGDLVSIPNGIDTALWNPAADAYLPGYPFSPGDMRNKAACKRQLQRRFGLPEGNGTTLMAMGSRLTTQKMADVAAQALPEALDAHPELQLCIVGCGEKPLEAALREVARRYPGRCAVHIGFDEALAHLLHAGADVLLHGSRFEPFGLTPLYSMRYGTIPIGSRVGGMADTILDPGPGAGAMRAATGVLFEGETTQDMLAAIGRAMRLRATPDVWRAMQQNAMKTDFSWARAAPAYMQIYQALRPDVAVGRVPEAQRAPRRVASGRPAPRHAPVLPGVRADTLVGARGATAA